MKDYELIDNKEDRRYEFHINGYKPHLDYVEASGDAVYLTHTIVPGELQGRGIGTALVESVLRDLDAKGKRIIPKCWFVVEYIEKHPEWQYLLHER
ncbi:MAG: N-acetyltransferase [Rikenellaceae bacterium]|nr:N-acetyltransferase [Rikenellaceae bacterium]